MDSISQAQGGQELSSALKEINVAELREATLSLGLKLGTVDLAWDTFVAQFNLALQRMQAEHIDVTSFVLLQQMLEHLRIDVGCVKNAAYVALTDILNAKDTEEFFKRLKREKAELKAVARLKRKLAAEENVSEIPEKKAKLDE
jgi:hypothetical protein